MENFIVKKEVQPVPEYIDAYKSFVEGTYNLDLGIPLSENCNLKNETDQDPNSNLQSKETPASKNVGKKNRYPCPVCKKDLLSMNLRNKHIKFHLKKLSEMCSLCGKYFANSLEYLNHSYSHIILKSQMKRQLCRFSKLKLSRAIPKREILECDKCLQRYVETDKYTDHISQCRSYRCQACSALFDEKYIFNKHIVENTIEHSYQCDKCSKEFYLKCHPLKCSIIEKISYASLQCKICLKFFALQRSLRLHMKRIHGKRGFSCKKCFKTLSTENLFNSHICCTQEKEPIHQLNAPVKKENSETSFQCKICFRFFPLQRSLRLHIVRTHGTREFNCKICSAKLLTKNSLNSHICHIQEKEPVHPLNESKKKGNSETFSCILCSRTFLTKNRLNSHICDVQETEPVLQLNEPVKKGNSETSFQCNICFRYFPLQRSLLCHIMRMHVDSKFSCKLCSRTFLTKNYFNSHICRTQEKEPVHPLNEPVKKGNCETSFKCKICFRFFPLRRTLQLHIVRTHGTREFNCKICSAKLLTKNSLNSHICHTQEKEPLHPLNESKEKGNSETFSHICDVQEKEPVLQLNEQVKKGNSETSFQCNICFRYFPLQRSLLCHIMRMHVDSKFSCKLCSRTFLTKNYFNSHICRTQEKEPVHPLNEPVKKGNCESSFKCKICFRFFPLRRALQLHIVRTHGTREFNCKICSAKLLTKNSLNSHICHTQEKEPLHPLNESKEKGNSETSFQCNICFRYFPLQRSLVCHLVRTHGDRKFSCKLCSRTFLTKNRLNGHSCSRQKNKLIYPINLSGSIAKIETMLKCKFCFTNGGSDFCRRHLRYCMHRHKIHHCSNRKNENYEKLVNKSVSTESTETFKCEICFKYFQLKRTLDCHMRIHKIEVKCRTCSRSFLTKNSYETHLCCSQKNETEETLVNESVITKHKDMFRCELCFECFPLKRNLYCHKRKHNELKCKTCFRIFSTVYNNENHVCYNQENQTVEKPLNENNLENVSRSSENGLIKENI